jgi:hypothetical protein
MCIMRWRETQNRKFIKHVVLIGKFWSQCNLIRRYRFIYVPKFLDSLIYKHFSPQLKRSALKMHVAVLHARIILDPVQQKSY